MNWHDLRFVLAAARSQTLAGAARELRVNESTVARRIAQAEHKLGARLFERTGGVLSPTEAGRLAVGSAERVEIEVQAIEVAIGDADRLAAGTVRITSVPLLVNRMLVPALPRLLDDHPDLRVELIAEPRDLSLMKGEADIALRLARPHKELRSLARRIGPLDYAVYAASHATAEPLPWITYEGGMTDLPQRAWIAERIARDEAGGSVLEVNDAEAILHGVKSGLGRSLLPVAVADREPGLVRVGDDGPALSRELWLMAHPELRRLMRIEMALAWIASTVRGLTVQSEH
ncbi:MAG: LysR family transcriptional regulator [Gammaproteobacteria bacterium]